MIDFDKSQWLLDPSDFVRDKKRKEIRSGFSAIQFCTQKSTNRNCVIKEPRISLTDESMKRSFERSISILATNQHPAIIPFVGFYERNLLLKDQLTWSSLLIFISER